MFKRLTIFVLLITAVVIGTVVSKPSPTFAQTCGFSNEISDPEPFNWVFVNDPNDPHYVGVLEYGEATFNINGQTLTTRAYRQEGGQFSIPGPTIHMEPGNRYVLQFRNLLPYEAPSPTHNDMKDPNITNVHTHGLHISGQGAGDDVTRMFEGGTGGDYIYDIPADHMGGTYWYHAHHHGSTYLQVSTGGFGLIIIDDSADGIPSTVAAMPEKQVIIGYLDPGAAGTGGDTLVSGTLPAGWTVNGKVDGNLCVSPDTWHHFRVLLADRDAKEKTVSISDACEVKLLARDGVWRTVAPKDLATRSITMTGASRADLAVRCSSNGTINVGTQTVANISIDPAGVADSGPSPYANGGETWSAIRPDYLRDLRGVSNVHRERINMGARTVNGSKFDINVPSLALNATDVQEWDIKGAGNHPFHLHVYHFQAMAGCGGDYEEGEYYDTIAASCAVRFDLNAQTSSVYEGRTIMHCHILEHEDQGAMGWLNVLPGPGVIAPPQLPSGYSTYYPLTLTPPDAPTALAAAATSSASIRLSWTDNSSDEAVFNIERSLNGTTFSPLASVASNSTGYTDNNLTAETTYWYRVNAGNSGGVSAWTNPASAITDAAPQPPTAPSGLSIGSATSNSLTLSWTDTSDNEDVFNIERSTDGTNFTSLTSVPANTTVYTDSNLSASTTYWYRVNAENTGGGSGWSTASGTTLEQQAATTLELGSLFVTLYNGSKGVKGGEATIVVVDNQGNVVEGATVTGSFSGAFSETRSGVTDASGTVILRTLGTLKGSFSVTFCVNSIAHPLLEVWSGPVCSSN